MLPGHSVAVNGAGLVQTINNIRAGDLKPGIPRHFVCRAILDEDSIPGVIGHLARRDRASGFHHALGMIGEESPLSVEAPASTTIIRTVAAPMAHANHLLDDTFEDADQAITASSKYRQDTVDTYLAEGGDPSCSNAATTPTRRTAKACSGAPAMAAMIMAAHWRLRYFVSTLITSTGPCMPAPTTWARCRAPSRSKFYGRLPVKQCHPMAPVAVISRPKLQSE